MDIKGKTALVTGGSRGIGKAIAPAFIETDMLNRLENVNPGLIPADRSGTAEEVANVAVMLVKNGYINNQTINANSGIYPSS